MVCYWTEGARRLQLSFAEEVFEDTFLEKTPLLATSITTTVFDGKRQTAISSLSLFGT